MDERIQNILDALQELMSDTTVPRNIKSKVEEVINILKQDDKEEYSMKINKALSALDEISDDTNLQAYTRTQLWNISSMLEMLG